MQEKLLQWRGSLYTSTKKSVDWFWILGLIVVLSTGLALYFRNYSFAAVLLIGGIAIGLFANEEVSEQEYKVDDKGIHIGDTLYPYGEIASFSVFTEGLPEKRQLLLTLKRTFFVHVSIPLIETDPEEVRILLRKFVLEKNRLPDLSDALMSWLKL
jgi:hypothetical protein